MTSPGPPPEHRAPEAAASLRRAAAAGAIYFAAVFAAGFALGAVRTTMLQPWLGERAAELAEMPVMTAIFLYAAHRLTRTRAELRRIGPALLCGGAALALMLAAEVGVVLFVRGESLAAYAAGRDPLSGAIYLSLLALFAAAPALLRPRAGA